MDHIRQPEVYQEWLALQRNPLFGPLDRACKVYRSQYHVLQRRRQRTEEMTNPLLLEINFEVADHRDATLGSDTLLASAKLTRLKQHLL